MWPPVPLQHQAGSQQLATISYQQNLEKYKNINHFLSMGAEIVQIIENTEL